jgi:hypothetical protein
LKPGNVGGGKDPDFWCAFEDGEVEVIGDEPENNIKRPDPSEIAVSWAKKRNLPGRRRARPISLRVPCGETGRKAGCGKSARPV